MPNNTELTEIIAACHRGLDELFLVHQETVLLGHFDDAIRLFDFFVELHRLHMDFENEQLIPKLETLEHTGQWPASLYKDEHNKVDELIDKTANNLLSLRNGRLSESKLRREVVAFLDWEKTLKGVCEHHQEREEAGMLPQLDKQTDAKWRKSIIGPFLEEWDDCIGRNIDLVKGMDFSEPLGGSDSPFLPLTPDQELFKPREEPVYEKTGEN